MQTVGLVDHSRPVGQLRDYPTRDHEMVATLARHGLLTMPLLMAAMRTSRTVTYRRFARCEAAGLVERLAVPVIGGLLRATREGQRYVGLAALPLALVRPGDVGHDLRCAEVGLRLEEEIGPGGGRTFTERELVLTDRSEEHPLASARLAQHGREGLHRPDLAVLTDAGTIAVEVELSIKAPRRLEAIMRAWRRADHVAEVRYLCGSGAVRRAVDRAVAATYADEKVRVLGMPQ
jgi:hypothetical protein